MRTPVPYVLSFALSATLLASCTGKDAAPSATVKAFLEASKKGDQSALLALVERQDRAFLEKARSKKESQQAFSFPEGAEYRLGEEKIDGERATVTVLTARGGSERSDAIKLVKEEGRWKIDLLPDEMLQMLRGVETLKKAAGGGGEK